MKANERLEEERKYIKNIGKATVSELSGIFKVTEETIRRDLDKLEDMGFVTRIHGGVLWNSSLSLKNTPFNDRLQKEIEAKRDIAIKASQVIKKYQSIFIDASTTGYEAVSMVTDHDSLNIVTNSAMILNKYSSAKFNIISCGGTLNKKSMSLYGDVSKENIQRFHTQASIISCRSLDVDEGIMDSNENDAGVKLEMMKNSEEVILLADHTKFDKKAFIKLIDVKKLNYIITDEKPLDHWIKFCYKHNIHLIY